MKNLAEIGSFGPAGEGFSAERDEKRRRRDRGRGGGGKGGGVEHMCYE